MATRLCHDKTVVLFSSCVLLWNRRCTCMTILHVHGAVHAFLLLGLSEKYKFYTFDADALSCAYG